MPYCLVFIVTDIEPMLVDNRYYVTYPVLDRYVPWSIHVSFLLIILRIENEIKLLL